MIVRYEVTDLSEKITAGGPSAATKRLFNATLALIDGQGAVRPYLAETLPQLGTESWQVLPDGRMVTSYRLRPGLTWHDGQPLTAEDFVFANEVYSTPALGLFLSTPQDQIDGVSAPDPLTLRISWRSLYPDAGALITGQLDPLPRHLLAQPFASFRDEIATRDAFAGLPYWTGDYVGAGPYRIQSWEPGSSIEGVAFVGHALGSPQIERVVVCIIGDENTALANVLSGAADLAADNALRLEQGLVIQREWEHSGRGRVVVQTGTPHFGIFQFRAEFLRAPGLLDLRVRQALVFSIDKSGLNEALFEGQGLMDDSLIPREMRYFSEVERAITKFPYDPRRTAELMTQAGFTRDGGFFASAQGDRFRPDLLVPSGPQFERQGTLLVDRWQGAGIDVVSTPLPAVQIRDNVVRAQFPGMVTQGIGLGERNLNQFTTAQISAPSNRWAGPNRGGYSHPEYDRLWESFNTTLDRSERDRFVVLMAKHLTEQLPAFPLYFNVAPTPVAAGLQGPEPGTPETLANWNIHEWYWK